MRVTCGGTWAIGPVDSHGLGFATYIVLARSSIFLASVLPVNWELDPEADENQAPHLQRVVNSRVFSSAGIGSSHFPGVGAASAQCVGLFMVQSL